MYDSRTTTQRGALLLLVMMLVLATSAFATSYYVATNGDDEDPGTIGEPFATLQKAAETVSAGDTCYIREGTYHQTVVTTTGTMSGTSGNPITFTNYPGEEVILDGTEAITGTWTQHSGSIYKINAGKDIWQLFVDGKMQVIARWPNNYDHPTDPVEFKSNGWEPVDGSWWCKTTAWADADMPGTDNNSVENNPARYDLGETGISFTGGNAVLSTGKEAGNEEREVNSHSSGSDTFTHDAQSAEKYPDGKSFILEKLDVLDKAEEWWFDNATNTIYLWADDGDDPTGRTIKGRTQSHAFDFTGTDYVTIKGLKFFATNFRTDAGSSCNNIRIEDCELLYPDATKRLLGVYTYQSMLTPCKTWLYGANNAFINNVMKYTDCAPLAFEPTSEGDECSNNFFYHTAMYGIGPTGGIQQLNKFTRNTMYVCGIRCAAKFNSGPAATRDQSYNYIQAFGLTQVPTDGAALQANSPNSVDAVRSYNWIIQSNRGASRWDGDTGTNGWMHHNVGLDLKGGLNVKGDYHKTYNNSIMGAWDSNDIKLPLDGLANDHSITRNNLADKMAGDRTGTVQQYPIPGTDDHNWNGYVEGTNAKLQLRDPYNHDFRPAAGADVIDAGYVISGITDGYLGTAPDIGAYEYGCTNYWIPGRIIDKAGRGVPQDGATNVKEDADLMWLEGKDAISNNVYFGTTSGSLTYQGNQSTNIYDPGTLSGATTYYWRIDTVTASDTITGDVWSFDRGGLPPGSWTQLTYDDFESGWGNYTPGGVDAKWYTEGTYAHQGTACADIEDDTGVTASFYHTNGIDVDTDDYIQLKVEFWFISPNFENGEDWWVQYYDGTDWNTVATYVMGTDFEQNTFYDKIVLIDEGTGEGEYTFPDDMKIRFMCDASGGGDDAYIDEIKVSGYAADSTDSTAPTAPTGIGATPGNSQVSLDWNDNTEGDLDGYNVYRSTTSGSGFSKINGSLVSPSDYTDSTVTNDTTYYFKVTAVDDSSNESGYSNEVSAMPEAPPDSTPPANPTGLAATGGDTQVSLDWNDNTEDDLDGYNVYRSTTSGSGYSKINGSLVSASAYTDGTVTNGTTYYFKVTAVDTSSNESGYSNEDSATPISSGNLQFNPTDDSYVQEHNATTNFGSEVELRVRGTVDKITDSYLKFTVSGVGGTVTTALLRIRSEATMDDTTVKAVSDTSWTEGTVIWNNKPAMGSTLDTESSIAATTWYSFDVTSHITGNGTFSLGLSTTTDDTSRDWSSKESAYDPILDVTYGGGGGDTTPPANPTGLGATPGDEQVVLDWNDNTEGDLDGYNVYRSTTSGSGFAKINGSVVSASAYTDSTVSNDTTYYYKVTAVDTSSNESGYSSEVSATPSAPTPPTAPSNLSATAVSPNQIDLEWDDNSDDEDGFKIECSEDDNSNFEQIDTVGANVTTYNSTGLKKESTYYYRVRAYNGAGNSSYSNEAYDTTPKS